MLNALLETFSCIYSETMLTIISLFQKLINGGGWNKSGGRLENFSKINKRGGDDYSALESNRKIQLKEKFDTISNPPL